MIPNRANYGGKTRRTSKIHWRKGRSTVTGHLTCGASTWLPTVGRFVVTDHETTPQTRDRSVGAVHSEAAGQEAGREARASTCWQGSAGCLGLQGATSSSLTQDTGSRWPAPAVRRHDAAAAGPHESPAILPISQGNSGLRKITRNLCLDFATFTWTGQPLVTRPGGCPMPADRLLPALLAILPFPAFSLLLALF